MVCRTNVPKAIEGILYDANRKLSNGCTHATVLDFVTMRLERLKKQVEREDAMNCAATEQSNPEGAEE